MTTHLGSTGAFMVLHGRQTACRHRWTQFELRSFWTAIKGRDSSRTYNSRRGPIVKMGVAKEIRFSPATLHYGRNLPQAQIDFRRTISVDRTNPLLLRRASDESQRLRPAHFWNEQCDFRPPFLQCGTTIFDMQATRSKVWRSWLSDRFFCSRMLSLCG